MERGSLTINSENILPIIKKWLYSDSDIFVRELVSNAADAVNKLKKLVAIGEAVIPEPNPEYAIKVVLDKENKTITVSDNGIGMTEDEIKQYINQIAFSGASDFLDKYKDKMDQSGEIIGHFGLGFYSAFMVADKVQIDTLSFKDGAVSARWISDGGTEYEISDSDRTERGTTVTLYVSEESADFLDEYKLRKILEKYCYFIPVEIYFDAKADHGHVDEHEHDENCGHEHDDSEFDDIDDTDDDIIDMDEAGDNKAEEKSKPKPINDTKPLWLKQANECTDEEYKSFYHKTFSDFNDPLFWIHLNMDYPFRLKGILYFPKLKHELESIEGQVKLYNNQVFIADNIKEVIPEFMLLLKGTMDCPDLPLNVSRSFLQNDGYVTKMSGYISRKVADKLNNLCKDDRENYDKYWDDISPFIKYGCIKDRAFYDKVKDSILFKTIYGSYNTLNEYLDKNKEKTGDKVFYVSNEQQQAQYIKLFKDQEMDAVVLLNNLDNPFISYLESYEPKFRFSRIDSDISDSLKGSETVEKELGEQLEKLFKDKLSNDKLKIKLEPLKTSTLSGMILLSEQSRRMQEMSKMFGGMGMDMYDNEETLVLNANSPLVKKLVHIKDDESRADDICMICGHIYDLAALTHKPLSAEAMAKFVERSNLILERLT